MTAVPEPVSLSSRSRTHSRPVVSVCIVNWNCRDMLRDCLRSLRSRKQGVRVEVVVVDNASTDGAADMVAREFPRVKLIRNSANAGFAREQSGRTGSAGAVSVLPQQRYARAARRAEKAGSARQDDAAAGFARTASARRPGTGATVRATTADGAGPSSSSHAAALDGAVSRRLPALSRPRRASRRGSSGRSADGGGAADAAAGLSPGGRLGRDVTRSAAKTSICAPASAATST